MNNVLRNRFYRFLVPASGLFLLGGCGLSDQQLTGVLSSVMTTGLTTLVNTIIAGVLGGGGAA